MIYRYTYKITCTHQDNIGDYYYGARITDIEPEKDPYKGSGSNMQTYHKQHPNCYVKEIIGTYDNDEDLKRAEYELIHPHLNDPHCLNLKEGGVFPDLAMRNKISNTLKDRKLPPEHYKHVCEGNKGKNKNRPCPEYQKQFLSEYNKGMKFLCKNGDRIRVKGETIQYYLSRGYHFGMK
jgi:hypothetical protein